MEPLPGRPLESRQRAARVARTTLTLNLKRSLVCQNCHMNHRQTTNAPTMSAAASSRLRRVNPALNAVVLKHYELAREAVRAGLPAGPLAGVPMLLKDLGLQLRGTVTSNGSVFFRDAVTDYDSTFVSRYRAAGLVIFGKSASPELGQTATTESKLWGLTRNPWNRDYSAGGSSGGAAAAVTRGWTSRRGGSRP